MSPNDAGQERGLAMSAEGSCAIKVHIWASPLLRAGMEQIFRGPCLVLSDAATQGLSRTATPEIAVPELFIVDEKYCPTAVLEFIAELKALNPAARVVLLADHFELNAIMAARHAGVDGFCLTASNRDVLVHSIALVLLGEVVVPSELLLTLMEDSVRGIEQPHGLISETVHGSAPQKSLSAREIEVLSWLREGVPNKTIARNLNLAETTVKVHVKAILRKIGAVNRAQAAIWAACHLPTETASDKR